MRSTSAYLSLLLLYFVLSGCVPELPVTEGPPYQKPPDKNKPCTYVFCRLEPEAAYNPDYCCLDGPQD
ncbi:MAG: hypothetical protein ACE5LB_08795 [Acidiferrobacterales bacterium]